MPSTGLRQQGKPSPTYFKGELPSQQLHEPWCRYRFDAAQHGASIYCNCQGEQRQIGHTNPRRETMSERARAKGGVIGECSEEQRAKVRGVGSLISGEGPCDPAHLWPRGAGGCDHELCVVPLIRTEHRAFDDGKLDLLPFLLAHGLTAEIQHALGHANGDLIGLLHRLTGVLYVPREAPR